MNVAIVGSRGFTEQLLVYRAIEHLRNKHGAITIVSGGAKGADTYAEQFAKTLGLATIIHLPDWAKFGKSAGFRRNDLIVRDADMVLAFFADGPRSPGTSNTVAQAKIAGKEVHVFHEGRWS